MNINIDQYLQAAQEQYAAGNYLQACQLYDAACVEIIEQALLPAYEQADLGGERTRLYEALIQQGMGLFNEEKYTESFPLLTQGAQYAMDSWGYDEDMTLYLLLSLRSCAQQLVQAFPLVTDAQAECQAYLKKCEVLQAEGEHLQMLGFADTSRKLAESALGKQHKIYGDCLYFTACGQMEAGNYSLAESQFKEALQAYQQAEGDHPHNIYRTLMKVGHLSLHHLKNATQTETAFAGALATALSLEEAELTAEAQASLGAFYFGVEKYTQALPLLQGLAIYLENHQALNLPEYQAFREMLNTCIEKQERSDDPHSWPQVYDQFLNALAAADLKQAQQQLHQMKILAEEEGKASLSWVTTLLCEGNLLSRLARYAEAEHALRQGIELCEKNDHTGEEVYAISLSSLAQVYTDQAKYPEAFQMGDQAMQALVQQFGEVSLAVAKARQNVGVLYLQTSQYPQAVASLTQARDTFKELVDGRHLDYLNCTHNLGTCLVNLGEYEAGCQLLEEVRNIQETAPVPGGPELGVVLQSLGHAYLMQGQSRDAEKQYQQAATLLLSSLGEDHPFYAHALVGLGKTQGVLGKHHVAEQYLNQAIAIFQSRLSDTHPYTLQARLNLGLHFQQLSQYKKSLRIYQAIKGPHKEKLGEDHAEYATLLINLGTTLFYLGQMATAETELRLAQQVLAKHVGEEHIHYRVVLNLLALSCCYQGRVEEGKAFFEQALQLWGQQHEKSERYFILLNNLGQLAIREQDYEQALSYTQAALQGISTHLSPRPSLLSAHDA